ncbi:MAG: hypothetical protein RDV48_29815 [Candidatus Eremiobacteraeota bacterium]|nr:hypothetical protein [Candidatus Eremiobacteraeota bacterium]
MRLKERLREAMPYLYAAAGYLVLALVCTWPIVEELRERVIGIDIPSPDIEGALWVHWWVRYAIENHLNMNVCPLIYFPVGKNVLIHIGNLAEGVAALPFYYAFGFPAYYNILCIVLMAFNGVAMFALFRRFTGDWYTAFLGGFVAAFNWYFFREVQDGHICCIATGLLALYVLFLLKVIEEERWEHGVILALVLAANCLWYWFFGVFLALFTILFLPLYYYAERGRFAPGAARRLAFSAVLFLVVILPFAATFLNYLRLEKTLPGTTFFEAFPPLSEVFGNLAHTDPRKLTLGNSVSLDSELLAYPYVLLLVGGLLPLFRIKESGYYWVVLWVFMFSLVSGPYLYVAGEFHGIRMPFAYLYQFFPMFSRLNFPKRLVVMALIPMGILFVKNMEWIKGLIKERFRWVWPFLMGILVVLTCAEFYWVKGQIPMDSKEISIPQVFHVLAREPDCALIEVPFLCCSKSMLYQTVHHKKLMGGLGEPATWLHSPDFVQFYKSNTFLEYLLGLNDLNTPPYATFKKEDLEALTARGFKYVIFYKGYTGEVAIRTLGYSNPTVQEEIATRIKTAMESNFGAPIYRDENLAIYRMAKKEKNSLGK